MIALPGWRLRCGGGTKWGESMCEEQEERQVFAGGRGAEAESLRAAVWLCIYFKGTFILGKLLI